MTPDNAPEKNSIIRKYFGKPPSPFVIGLIVVIAIVLLVSAGYGRNIGRSPALGINISVKELSADYDSSTHKYRSFQVGDKITIMDTVKSISIYTYNPDIILTRIILGNNPYAYFYASGDVVNKYPVGTMVVITTVIVDYGGYEYYQNGISPSQIRVA